MSKTIPAVIAAACLAITSVVLLTNAEISITWSSPFRDTPEGGFQVVPSAGLQAKACQPRTPTPDAGHLALGLPAPARRATQADDTDGFLPRRDICHAQRQVSHQSVVQIVKTTQSCTYQKVAVGSPADIHNRLPGQDGELWARWERTIDDIGVGQAVGTKVSMNLTHVTDPSPEQRAKCLPEAEFFATEK